MNKNILHSSSNKIRCYMGYSGIHQNLLHKKIKSVISLKRLFLFVEQWKPFMSHVD